MQLLIVTGYSGAGKSKAVDTLEDIGYYCVDNMPSQLISKFIELCQTSGIPKVALVIDSRSPQSFSELISCLQEIDPATCVYKILFLTADREAILRRYKETRRKHPLINGECTTIEQAFDQEMELLELIKGQSDYVIDTSELSISQLKEKMLSLFLNNISDGMLVSFVSFGFKYGIPIDADLTFDVRCLPNPFYIKEMKEKTGMEAPVRDYVMSFAQSQTLAEKLTDLLEFLIPLYIQEGKSQLVVAVGCTGGKHRSVTFANLLQNYFKEKNVNCAVNHRDIAKR